jgi:hypothetical protein
LSNKNSSEDRSVFGEDIVLITITSNPNLGPTIFFLIQPLGIHLNSTKISNHVVHTPKSPVKGQGNANFNAVWILASFSSRYINDRSGLDNAGKTTIVKRIMNEDITTVSPTLGFIIKTIDFMG